jgi:hypothetical protein
VRSASGHGLDGRRIAVYSLVNAPTVGFDLARLPTGAAVATVLLEALAVQSPTGEAAVDLGVFDAANVDDPRRAAAWLEVSALTPERRLDDALSAVRQLVDDAASAIDLSAPSVRELEPVLRELTTASFGGLEDLLRLVRVEILDETPVHVVALASDALAAAYGGRRLPEEVRALLRTPWVSAARTLPRIPADLGPFAADLHTILDRVASLTAAEAGVLVEVDGWSDLDWSGRMHAAAWAGYLSGRLRPAAAAQFQAVRALRACGVDASFAARGVWNAVSGCVQAVGLHDLLDEVTYGVLVAPWERVVGILG